MGTNDGDARKDLISMDHARRLARALEKLQAELDDARIKIYRLERENLRLRSARELSNGSPPVVLADQPKGVDGGPAEALAAGPETVTGGLEIVADGHAGAEQASDT